MTTINETPSPAIAASRSDITPAAPARPVALSLRANFSWTFVGNVVYAGCQWAMLVVLAKLGTPEMVGQFALGLAIASPVIMFANLQLRGVQATDAKRRFLFADYLGLRLTTSTIAALVIAVLAFIGGYHFETALVILVIGLAKAVESVSDVFYGFLQQQERMDQIAKAQMLKGPLSLLMLGMLVALTGSVFVGAIGLLLAWTVVLVIYVIPGVARIHRELSDTFVGDKRDTLRPRWSLNTLAKLTWLALPLGVVMMLISLNTNIPRYVLERYEGEHGLGIFAAMSYLMVAGTTVVSALGQSASPRLAKYYAGGNLAAFRNLLLKLVGIGLFLGLSAVLVVAVAGKPILTLLYRPEYAEQSDVFIWVTMAAAAGYVASFLGFGMTAARYFKVQAPLFAVVTGATALLSLWLVPEYGLQGAAYALLLSAVVQVGGGLAVVTHAIYRLKTDYEQNNEA